MVAYGSRVLSKAERRYCVTRRELLAVVYFLQHFRPYLLGRHFTLRSDHGSLTWLRNFKEPEGQLARWLEKQGKNSKKLHHPWSGPWKVVKSLSEAVYKGPSGSKQRRMIVHFDRLKPCPKGTEFVTLRQIMSNNHQLHQYVAENIEDDDEAEVTTTRRYPQRVRHAPTRYSDYIPLTCFNVGHISSKEGAM